MASLLLAGRGVQGSIIPMSVLRLRLRLCMYFIDYNNGNAFWRQSVSAQVSAYILLGLFHLKVWGGGGGGGRRNGRFFEGGEGPNSELVYTIRVYVISGRRGRGVSDF